MLCQWQLSGLSQKILSSASKTVQLQIQFYLIFKAIRAIYSFFKMKIVPFFYIITQIITTVYLAQQLTTSTEPFYIHLGLTLATSLLYLVTSYKQPRNIDPQQIEPQQSNQYHISNQITSSKHDQISNSALIAKRRCQTCMINQLIRMKHCRQCGICVPTFDHHCFWISNCVGQKNRPIFYVFIVVHFVQVVHAMVAMIQSLYSKGSWQNQQISFLSFVGILIFGLGSLIITHTYLMVVNLTTWQLVSWRRITYLHEFNQEHKSPFSLGVYYNVVNYWYYGFKKQNHKWKFNDQAVQRLMNRTMVDQQIK